MPITLNGSGTVSGISAGGLPDGIIQSADLASGVGGKILQVVTTKKTDAFTTTSSTYVDVMTATITPTSNTSKILVRFMVNGGTAGDVGHLYVAMFRDSTEIGSADAAGSRTVASNVINTITQSTHSYTNEILDTPATDSAITYRIKILAKNNATANINRSARDNNAHTHDGRSTSFITLMEVAA